MTTTEPRPTGTRNREPDRNLAVELIRATEAAAMAPARYLETYHDPDRSTLVPTSRS